MYAAGGSASVPEGDLVVRLYDGAIGPTQLSQAEAHVSLDAAQRLSFGMDFAPAEPRSGGLAKVKGSLPLFVQPKNKSSGKSVCNLLCLYKPYLRFRIFVCNCAVRIALASSVNR